MINPIPEDRWIEIRSAVFRGQKIEAIELHMAASGASLAEARAAVEGMEAELRAASPEKFVKDATKGGCMGVLVVWAVVLVVLWVVWR